MSLTIETLVVKLQAQAGEYQQQIRKVVEDTKAATGNIAKTINSALAAQKQAAREAAKAAAQAKRETERAVATEIRLAQQRDSTIAKHYLQSHLRSLDQAAAADRRAADQAIRTAQRRDSQIARNHVREHFAAAALVAREQRSAAAIAARNATVGSRTAGIAGQLGGAAGRLLPSAGIMRLGRRVALGAGGIAAASVGAFATFDDSINRAVAVAGGASDELRARMATNAKQIATSSITGAHDVARSYLEMTQAGYSLGESLNYVRDIQRFAVAANLDMSRSVELLSQSTRALGLNGPDAMRRVADATAKAANMTTASIADLAASMTNKSAAAARVLGKDLTELVAVLSAYASAGVRGELAGEKTYMLWRDLQTAALKQSGAWKALGLSVYDANGAMRSTADIIAQLEGFMANLSTEQKKQTLLTLGMTDRSQAATIQLLGLSGAIRQYEAELKNANGESDRLARMIEGSFLSSLKNLWNHVVVLGLEIGERLAPFVRLASAYIVQLTDTFSRLLRNVSDTTAWKIFQAEMEKAIKVAGAVLGELVAWTDRVLVPQLYSAARTAGGEFAKGFVDGFLHGGVDWQERLQKAVAGKAEWESDIAKKTGGRLRQAREMIGKFEQEIAEAKAHLGIVPQGQGLQARIGAIIQQNYGAKPSANVAVPAGFNRPDVVAPSSATRPKAPSDITDALDSLSPEGKAEAKAAGKATDKAAAAAKRVQDRLILESKRIHDAVRTPLETVNDELAKARELLNKGLLSAQDFSRLRDKLFATLDKAGKAAGGKGRSGGGGGLGDGFSSGLSSQLGFRNATGDDVAGDLVRQHLAQRQAHLQANSASRRAGKGDVKPAAPRMSPQEFAADQQAKNFGYSGLAGAQRSIAGAQAAAAGAGRIVMAPAVNPLAARMPQPATGSLAALHDNERFAEIARRDEASLRANIPNLQQRQLQPAQLAAGGAGGQGEGFIRAEGMTGLMSQKSGGGNEKMVEILGEILEVLEESKDKKGSTEIVAAGF